LCDCADGIDRDGDLDLADGELDAYRDKKSAKELNQLEVAIGDGMEFTIHGKRIGNDKSTHATFVNNPLVLYSMLSGFYWQRYYVNGRIIVNKSLSFPKSFSKIIEDVSIIKDMCEKSQYSYVKCRIKLRNVFYMHMLINLELLLIKNVEQDRYLSQLSNFQHHLSFIIFLSIQSKFY